MKKYIIIFCLFFITFLLVSRFVEAEDSKVDISKRWTEGVYSLQQDSFVSAISSVNKKVTRREQARVAFTWDMQVGAVESNGVQQVILKMTRIMVRFEYPNEELMYIDTANDLNSKPFVKRIFETMHNVPILIYIKEDGKVEQVLGCGDLWKSLPDSQKNSEKILVERLKNLLTEGNFKEVFESFGYVVPVQSVDVNDVWTSNITLDLPVVGEKELAWNCKLDSISGQNKKSIANVSADSLLTLDLSDSVNAKIKTDVKAKFSLKDGPQEIDSRATVTVTNHTEDESVEKTVGLIRTNMTVVKH